MQWDYQVLWQRRNLGTENLLATGEGRQLMPCLAWKASPVEANTSLLAPFHHLRAVQFLILSTTDYFNSFLTSLCHVSFHWLLEVTCIKHILTIQSSNPTSESLSKKIEIRISGRCFHSLVHCKIINNSYNGVPGWFRWSGIRLLILT